MDKFSDNFYFANPFGKTSAFVLAANKEIARLSRELNVARGDNILQTRNYVRARGELIANKDAEVLKEAQRADLYQEAHLLAAAQRGELVDKLHNVRAELEATRSVMLRSNKSLHNARNFTATVQEQLRHEQDYLRREKDQMRRTQVDLYHTRAKLGQEKAKVTFLMAETDQRDKTLNDFVQRTCMEKFAPRPGGPSAKALNVMEPSYASTVAYAPHLNRLKKEITRLSDVGQMLERHVAALLGKIKMKDDEIVYLKERFFAACRTKT